MTSPRMADHPIEPVFLDRWSPRAFDGEELPESDLLTILEAARWAPSAYNIQPWRFLYARPSDAHWDAFMGVLDSFNASWAGQAGALVMVLSDTVMPGDGERPDQPSRCHTFDAGAAWAQLALQATALGYQAHAMAGLDYLKARTVLNVPARFRIEIAVAIGRRGAPEALPEGLRQRELPSPRRPLDETAFVGPFPS